MNQRLSRKKKREQQPGYRPPPKPSRRKERPQPNIFFSGLVMITGILGILCLIGVGLKLQDIRNASAHADLVRTLPDVTTAAPGETAILDGRIAASEPARYKDFVAYIRERERGGGRYSPRTYELVDQAKPAFAVEAGSRRYQLANGDYRFDRFLFNWMDAERIDEGPSTFSGAVRIQGLLVQSPVMAVGRLVPGEDGATDLRFHADSLAGLSRADYVDRLDASVASSWQLAGILGLLGPFLAFLGWRGLRRMMA